MRARLVTFVVIIQSILFLAHGFVYETWRFFWHFRDPVALPVMVALLSVSFVCASLLAFRYDNAPVHVFYRVAALWLGMLNFFVLAACACWIAWPVVSLAGIPVGRPAIASLCFGLAALAGLYGVGNAARVRVNRITVTLPGLPDSWRGRQAVLVSDTHLGPVRGYRFSAQVAAMVRQLGPDIVFIAGDLFDGTSADYGRLALPWKEVSPPFGTYFVTGNHEEFSDPSKYLDAVRRAGIRALRNEKVIVDGLQIAGVNDRDSGRPDRFGSVLDALGLDRARASLLLVHTPHSLAVAESRGVTLQLSGHTHGGQIFPFTRLVSRAFGPYTYGLRRFGSLTVYTSSGAGTWGPPMRVGTRPEITLIRFA